MPVVSRYRHNKAAYDVIWCPGATKRTVHFERLMHFARDLMLCRAIRLSRFTDFSRHHGARLSVKMMADFLFSSQSHVIKQRSFDASFCHQLVLAHSLLSVFLV